MSDTVSKVTIVLTRAEMRTTLVNFHAETNLELTDKLRAIGTHPFWWSWHPQKDGSCIFRAFGVPDKNEAVRLQFDNRAARIRIGLKP